MKPYYADDAVTLHHGDALEVLRELPGESVRCCVTSPPYYGLRDYGVPGQYGLEPTPGECRCILAGCKPGGVVLDPFAGSCTTGMVAQQLGHRFVGVDLSAEYLDLALKTRLAQTALVDAAGVPQ